MAGRDDPDEREARQILDRVGRETSPDGSLAARLASRTRDHLAAADSDRTDPVEVWGTRIGRALGLLIAIGIMGWLVWYLLARPGA